MDNITHDEYHALPGVSNSRLNDFIADPRLYWYKYLSGEYKPESKPYFDFGTAVHSLLLEPSNSNVYPIPEDVLSSGAKRGKAWKEFEADHAGCILLKSAEYESVQRCVEAVRANRYARALLDQNGLVEQAFKYEHDSYGLTLRCRPDKYIPKHNLLVDLKTCGAATTRDFGYSVSKYGYHRQEYFYTKVMSALGYSVGRMVFIAVSKTPPYTVDCYTLDGEYAAVGCEQVERALAELSRRTRDNDWFEPCLAPTVLECPAWLRSVEPEPELVGFDDDE